MWSRWEERDRGITYPIPCLKVMMWYVYSSKRPVYYAPVIANVAYAFPLRIYLPNCQGGIGPRFVLSDPSCTNLLMQRLTL